MIAAFDAAYAACGSPAVVEPSTLPMLMMLPPSFIARPHACAIQYEPFRLMSITLRNSSGSSRVAGTAVPIPALLTSTSTLPSCSTVSSTTRWQSSGLATSAFTAMQRRPVASTFLRVSSSFSTRRAQMAMSAPASASASAKATPSPDDAPVTIATLPSSLKRSSTPIAGRIESHPHRMPRVRALQIVELGGPSSLKLVDIEEPGPQHMLAPDGGVVVDVKVAGVSFPEVLQSRGQYQFKPPLPFVPGAEVGGVVRSAPEGSAVSEGDRVAAMCMLGGFAEVAVAPPFLTFKLPDELDAAQGAGLGLNYHTAYFALKLRGRLEDGETVLVHGAAGGVGTASIQVANGLGARTIAVVSSDEKEEVARQAGADEVLRSDGPWKDQAKELSGGGVDIVLDPVGGDRFTDSLRSLREGGRIVVVGFTGGSIPGVRVNRLLLNNTEVIGAGWGAFAMGKPEANREIGDAIARLAAAGAVRPIVGERLPLERAADALALIEQRQATGKVVLEVRS